MSALDLRDLTDREYVIGFEAYVRPVILRNPQMKRAASGLAKKGFGAVEDGASGERIFRLNQAGEDAFAPAVPANTGGI